MRVSSNINYNKTCLSGHLNIDKIKILMETGSFMNVKSIAECPWSIRIAECPWSILQYIWTSLSDNWYRKPIVGLFLVAA